MPTLDSAHNWQFTIDGVDVTDYVDPNSVAMTDAEGAEVDTLYLELVDVDGALDIAAWQEISWTIDPGTADELIWFGGFVIDPQYSTMDGDQGRVWRLKCEGYGTLLARLPAGLHSWVDSYPGDIVVDLLDQAGLTSQDSEVGLLSYLGNDTTTAAFGDAGQTWADWDTTSGDAGYALVVTNTDGTISWGYLGALSGSDITVYQDLALTSRGWNGVLPVAGSKAPDSYHVRRAELFSGHRPIDTTNVSTGDNALLSFGTTTDETIAQVLVRLAKQLGYAWRIDAEAGLHFGEPALWDPAPFNVSDGPNATYVSNEYYPARAGTFSVSRDNGMDICNRILVHGGAKSSGETTELFYGTASGRVYQLSHHNLIDITVLVNGSVVADGTVWWNTFDDRVVLVNYAEGWIWFAEGFLIFGDTINVIYRYWEGLEYEIRDEASIEQCRQVFTYELTDRSITSEERAAEVAQGILDEYSNNRYAGSFEVWRLGLRAGQDIKLKFPSAGLDDAFVIRKMDCRIDPSNTGLIVYCEFGSRRKHLSNLISGSGAASTTDQVWLSQLGPYAAYTRTSIAKPAADAVVALAKQHTAIVDASSNDVDITLPPALTREGDSVFIIRVDTSANTVTLKASGSEKINNLASLTIGNDGYEGATCYSDGENWYTISRDFSKFLLTTGARTGASSEAQAFANGIIGPSWRPSADSTDALQMQNAGGDSLVELDTVNNILRTTGYIDSSNFASNISGFRLDGLTGNAEFNNGFFRGMVSTIVFNRQFITAASGSMIVSTSATTLYSDLVIAPTMTLDVNANGDMQTPLQLGDIVRIKTDTLDLWATITSSGTWNGSYAQYTATRSYGSSSGAFKAGLAVVNYGSSGQGVILLSADDTYSPMVSIATHSGSPWSGLTERLRLGNLNGVSGASGYGLWTDNGYFTGVLHASDGDIAGWTIASGHLYAGTGVSRAGMRPATYPFYAGSEDETAAPFRVTSAGALAASSGTIGGWTLGAVSLSGGDAILHNDGYIKLGTSNDIVRLDAADATYRLWAGHATAGSAPFRVTRGGALTATSATITGTINASAGNFTGAVYVGAADPRIKIDGTNKTIESTNYASSTSGFRIDGVTGNAEFNNIRARGSISTAVFVKSLVSAFAGSSIVSKSASRLVNDFTIVNNGATTTLDVDLQGGYAPFGSLEIVRIKDETNDVWATIGAGSDQTTFWRYTVTVNSGGGTGTITAGATVVDYGESGAGYVLSSADETYAPYVSVATHNGEPWMGGISERARLGNLAGISGASGYGLWTDNGYFTGAVTASSGSFSGFLTIGTDGGIYQGTGTSSSPTTGLKVWNDSGKGRIAGYNNGTIQWYADTDGKLYAGSGATWLDSDGTTVLVSTASGGASANSYKFKTSGGTERAAWRVYEFGSVSYSTISHNAGSTSATSQLSSYSTNQAQALLKAEGSSVQAAVIATVSSGVNDIELRSDTLKVDGGLGTESDAAMTVYGKVTIDQSNDSSTGAALTIEQSDVSEPFLKLIGTSSTDADQSLVDAADRSSPGTIKGWIRIQIQDDQSTNPIVDGVYFIPFYSTPMA